MKTILKLLLIFVFTTFTSCEKIDIDESDKLIGHWINPDSNGPELKLERANSLKKDEYGISFLKSNECIERSSGWCGTPPITYSNYHGTWSKQDQIISISIEQTLKNQEWEIKTLNDKYLVIERLDN